MSLQSAFLAGELSFLEIAGYCFHWKREERSIDLIIGNDKNTHHMGIREEAVKKQ